MSLNRTRGWDLVGETTVFERIMRRWGRYMLEWKLGIAENGVDLIRSERNYRTGNASFSYTYSPSHWNTSRILSSDLKGREYYTGNSHESDQRHHDSSHRLRDERDE